MSLADRPAESAIRRAKPTDAAALTRLVRHSGAYEGPFRPMVAEYRVTPEQLRRDEVHLLDIDGDVAGFYSLQCASEAELDLLFVADRAQSAGHGQRLFRHMQALAARRGYRQVRIVSHPPATGFYLRMGARRTGVCPAAGKVSWERPILRVSTV